MNNDLQDRVDDYLLNRMSDEERVAFEQEMANDAELQERVMFMRSMLHALKSRNEKLSAMKEWEDDYVWENESQVEKGNKRKWLYWASSIAAVFVAGLFIFQFQFLGDSNLDPNGWVRGTSYPIIDTLIVQEKYQEALVQIEDETQTLRNEYLEISQDSLISEEALEYNMLLIKEKQDDLKWQTALALLGMGQKEVALVLLDDLRKEKGSHQKDAKALYRLVKRGR